MKEKLKKALPVCALVACVCAIAGWVWIHRRVILAAFRGEELPEAPAWHVWCRGGSAEKA